DKPKTPFLTNISKETPKKDTSGKGLVSPNRTGIPAHAQTMKNPLLLDEFVGLPPNAALPKYVPYDIAQVLSQIKIYVPIVKILRIPKHMKRAFEYLGLKEEKIAQGRNIYKVDTPTISELEKPQVLEELGEPPK
ncbi:hypothetical protein KI387_011467, partial [Taxus chinensis]